MIPIVLVHGFGGWGREEMAGKFWYWGGFSDLQAQLNSGAVDGREVRVMTAAVGPFSSVWDRAVELFYQIKGGTVDYGAVRRTPQIMDTRASVAPFLDCIQNGTATILCILSATLWVD